MNVKKHRNRRLITTGVVAAHCDVSYEAVTKWIRAGKLPAYTTPGGQHRIHIDDFQDFLDTCGMPPFDPPPVPRRKLLIVDDHPGLAQTIHDFFIQTTDYECTTAVDGFEAGTKVLLFRPDLVILDLMMPHLNGIEVCRRIKTTPETQRILVVAMTGSPEEGNRERVLAVGAEACLVKPFRMETVKQQVEAVFAAHRSYVRPRRTTRPVRRTASESAERGR